MPVTFFLGNNMSKLEDKIKDALQETDDILENINTVKGEGQVAAVSFACTMKAYIDLNVTFLHSLGIEEDAFETYTQVSTLIATKLMSMYTEQLGLATAGVGEAMRTARTISEHLHSALGDVPFDTDDDPEDKS